MKVLIIAGGTGGHIMPALAVSQELMNHRHEVHWLGTLQGLEQQIIPATKIPLYSIQVHGIRRSGLKSLITAPINISRAIWQSIKIINKIQPDIVIGFGGFVGGPGCLAARLLCKPLIIHEQNSVAGFTNKCLAYIADMVLQAFPSTFKERFKPVTVGNPVRESICNIPEPRVRLSAYSGKLRLLILGGSQGAATFNEIIPKAIALMPEEQRPHILHIAGKDKADKARQNYQDAQLKAEVIEYTDNMAETYQQADLVISRAGALTVSELAAAGMASILIPFPFAVDDHQTHNAAFLANAQAAILIPQNQLNSDSLASLLLTFTHDRNRLLSMAESAYRLRKINSAQQVIEVCQKLLTKR